jgi:heat shock protein HslJ
MKLLQLLFIFILLTLYAWTCGQNLPVQNLSGRQFKLFNLMGDTSLKATFPDGMPELEFSDTVLMGFTGCNRFFGSYIYIGDKVQFNPGGMTKKYCEGVNESGFIDALSKSDDWKINADTLWLYSQGKLSMGLLEIKKK